MKYSIINKKFLSFTLIVFWTPAICQDNTIVTPWYDVIKVFASPGCIELGGTIGFESTTKVENGIVANSSSTQFSLSPYIGYFVSKGFEIGIRPIFQTTVDTIDLSQTLLLILAGPSYNFNACNNVYPFIEVMAGYSLQNQFNGTRDFINSGFSWGVQGGVKVVATGNGLLNVGLRYIQITLDPEGATERFGANQFALFAGFTVWF